MNLEPPNRQHRKVAAAHHPELHHNNNNVQNQLNGHFGLPVYQYLNARDKSPHPQRISFKHAYAVPKELRHYQ